MIGKAAVMMNEEMNNQPENEYARDERYLNCDSSRSDEVIRLFEKASNLHHGRISGGVPDLDGAIECYLQAAAAGSVDAMIGLGNLYEEKEDFENAYYWYHEAAVAGSVAGIYNVAWMYHTGRYVTQDYEKAKAYFTQLYDRNVMQAAFYLGLYAESGYAGPVDYSGAVRYYKEGVEQGDPLSANNLGTMYCRGKGVRKNKPKGFQLFLKSYNMCDDGNVSADICANLAQCYEKGFGTDKDLLRALKIYQEGAELGDELCEERLKRVKTQIAEMEVQS